MEFKTLEKVYFRQKLVKSIQFKTTFKGKRKRKTKKKNLKEIKDKKCNMDKKYS